MFKTIARSFATTLKGTTPQFTHGGIANIDKVAVFSSKRYDIDGFTKFNNKADKSSKLTFEFHSEELNQKTAHLITEAATVCAFVNDKLDERCLNVLKEKDVKLIALRCAGFNNVNLPVAKKLDIKVVRVPAYSPYAVAEHAMALLLTLNRKVHKAYNRTKEGNFALDGLLGFDIHGKTVGVIGGGKIGQCFASICKGFGVDLIYHDVNAVKEMDALGARKVDLETLFKKSDIISLHCPLTPDTKYIINKNTLEKMMPHAYIVNTGRGALIDTKACIKALKQRKLGGLAIDVYEQEENIFFKDHSTEILTNDELARLLTFPNVIVTGHQAFFTQEALDAICDTTIRNINEIRTSGTCKNEVAVK